MGLRALTRIEHCDAETGELHTSNPTDPCDYLPDDKAAQYLELGLIERVGGDSESEPDTPPVPDAAAGADTEGHTHAPDLEQVLADKVKDVSAAIAAGKHDAYLDELDELEAAQDKPRKGVRDAIAKRQAEIDPSGEE